MDLKEEILKIENELADLIVAHLRENKIDASTASRQAKEFLALLPFADQKDLLAKLKQLGEKYGESQELYVEELAKVSNQERDKKLNSMRAAIRKGDIEQALTIAKQQIA